MKIYQPPGAPFDPEFVDCLENALTRQNVSFTTQSTSLVAVRTVPLVANLFDVDGKRVLLETEGNLDSVAGSDTVQFGFTFDGAALFAVSITTVRDGGSVLPKIRLYRRGANLVAYLYVESEPPQATQSNAQLSGNWALLSNVDFSVAHTVTLTARVGTATSTLTLGALSGSVL